MSNMAVVKKGAFDLHTFVVMSCLIDPQRVERDSPFSRVYPAVKPGQLMYDNTINAFELAKDLSSENFYLGLPMDLHRTLTKDIPWYEDQNLSGRYRKETLEVGGRECPMPWAVDFLMRERWFPKVQEELASFDGTPQHALDIAFRAHHAFEYIHPFADGNGRTGRLLLNYFLMKMGQPCLVIWYKKRHEYYNSINAFIDKDLNEYLRLLKENWPI